VNDWSAALAHGQPSLWVLLLTTLAAVAFRWSRAAERRARRLAWAMVAIALLLELTARVSAEPVVVAMTRTGAAVFAGLAAIQVAGAWFFRGVLPAVSFRAPRIAQDLAVTALSVAWTLLALRLAGADPSQLFTTSALITAVLAFSMQDTLGNVLGGVALQLDNSLRVGDWVKVDDVSGRVADVRWRYTAVETRSRELVIIPNSWLMKNRFLVIREAEDGALAWRRAITINADAAAPPAQVIQALEAAVADARIEHVLLSPPPSAILSEIGSGYCKYTLRYWLADPRYDDPGDSAVRIHAMAALARAGVRLGVPQEERLTVKENAQWRSAAERLEAERRLHAIRSTELFARLSAAEQESLAKHLIHAPFAAGDIMTREGAVAHWLYLVVQGDAQVLVNSPQGPVEVAGLHPGDVFGEMGMLTGEPRGATVIATTAVDCFRLDKAGFAQVLQQRPEMAGEITTIVQVRNAQRDARLHHAGREPRRHEDLLARIMNFFAIRV
jgi:small-conductance mechanosensitive channel/CRP-like cAMP-binding protein